MKLEYNGVVLPLKHSNVYNYVEEPVWLEDGSYQYTRYVIGCRTVIGVDLDMWAGGPALGTVPSAIINDVRQALQTPRKLLRLTGDDGGVLVEAPDLDLSTPNPWDRKPADDSRLGPIPLRVSVKSFSPKSYIVEFEVECYMSHCGVYKPTVIRNLWEVSVSYDQDWFATHTVSGQLVLNGSTDESALNFAGLVTVPLMEDFIRTNFSYVLSKDGRVLNYSFEDVQQYVLPPCPATTASGTFSISTRGALLYAKIALNLSAPKHVKKTDLLAVAARIVIAYATQGRSTTRLPGGLLRGVLIETDLFKNNIRMRASWIHADNRTEDKDGPGDRAALLNAARKAWWPFGVDPGKIINRLITNREWKDPKTWGSLVVATLHNSLKEMECEEEEDAADPTRDISPDEGEVGFWGTLAEELRESYGIVDDENKHPCVKEEDQGYKYYHSQLEFVQARLSQSDLNQIALAVEVEDLPLRDRLISDEHLDHVYPDYRIASRYVDKEMVFAFPRSNPDSTEDAVVLRVCKPLQFRVVQWQAERIGEDPNIPNPETPDDAESLLSAATTIDAPQLTVDGFEEQRGARGAYAYVVKRKADEMKSGKLPHTSRDEVHTMDVGHYEDLIS